MPRNPNARQATPEEARDVIADQQHRYASRLSDDLYVVGIERVAVAILGFSPINNNLVRPGYPGHRSKDSQINEHLSISTLRRVLDQLVEEGVLAKLNKPIYPVTETLEGRRLLAVVRFYPDKAGWVTTDALEDAYARLDARQRDRERSRLMTAAQDAITKKYAAEVQQTYERLCRQNKLDPQRETAEEK